MTWTAGVSPASSKQFTQATAQSDKAGDVAFSDSGRDARGPSKEVLGDIKVSGNPAFYG